MKDYPVITLILYIILTLVIRMVIQDGGMSLLERLLQKSLRCKHHRENYIESLEEKVYTSGIEYIYILNYNNNKNNNNNNNNNSSSNNDCMFLSCYIRVSE